MSVSVVILNWNGEKYLDMFLPFLKESVRELPDAEIVVADNGSTDGSLKLLNEKYPDISVIEFKKNYGFSGGYNRALKKLKSEYYVLLNSDVEVTKDWLKVLYDYMQVNLTVAACQPKILSYHNRNYFEYAGAAGGFIDKYGYPFCRGRIFGEIEEDKGQYDAIKDVFWASGACLMIRSKDYWEAGGLDEAFFAHQEEIDLCWRLKSRGRRIVCNPQSVIYHIGGGTLEAEHPRKTFLNFRNNLLMLYKNLPHKNLHSIFRTRFYLDNLAAAHFALQGKFKNMRAITDARTEFRNLQESFTEKRNENILKSVRSTFKEVSQNSLLYEFYVKRNRKFSDLPRTELAVEDFEE
ncbi:MAG: glycosyltransferase family 2 protein [Porphyromonadaceae bacterium]|nr:glycosyltransferase family 2 protein [Porphyromonadaceae bacterium]